MKLTLIIVLIFSSSLWGMDQEIKTKDLKNTQITSNQALEGSEGISPEQLEVLKKQIEVIKENKKKSEEFLEELDKE